MNAAFSPKPLHLLPLVALGLLAGVSGGWIRLGSPLIPLTYAGASHGLLMVGSFLGTLISLERAMVMKPKVWLLVPLLSGISLVPLLFGETEVGILLLLTASVGLSAIMHLQTVRHPHFHTMLLYAGAVSWTIGNFLVFRMGLVAAGSTWWMGFLLYTIIGERLELSQFVPVPTWGQTALKVLLSIFTVGLVLPFHGIGPKVLGLASLGFCAWLLYFDMAKIAARKAAQFRYIGIGLRVGYVWLGLQGLVFLLLELHPLYYDLLLHTFFLGFTFSMIWAHAPIIFPMIFGIRQSPYHPVLWISWLGFQLTLAGRMVFGALGWYELRSMAGVANGILILVQFALMAGIVVWKVQQAKSAASHLTSNSHG